MAETTVVKTSCDGSIVLTDGTSPTALTYTVALEAGDFSCTPPRKDEIVIHDRCDIAGSRLGRLQPGQFQFVVHFRHWTGSTDGSIIDFIDGRGAYSARVSVDAGQFEGNVFSVAYTAEGTDHGDNADTTITFPKCRVWWAFTEGDPSSITVTGTILAAPTVSGGTGA